MTSRLCAITCWIYWWSFTIQGWLSFSQLLNHNFGNMWFNVSYAVVGLPPVLLLRCVIIFHKGEWKEEMWTAEERFPISVIHLLWNSYSMTFSSDPVELPLERWVDNDCFLPSRGNKCQTQYHHRDMVNSASIPLSPSLYFPLGCLFEVIGRVRKWVYAVEISTADKIIAFAPCIEYENREYSALL